MYTTLPLFGGDVHKINVINDGTIVTLQIYDGTTGDKNDLLIQATLTHDEAAELSRLINPK